MPRKGDPDNKVRDGMWVDDERKSIIERNDDGSTTFHRHYGGEWHSFTSEAAERDANNEE